VRQPPSPPFCHAMIRNIDADAWRALRAEAKRRRWDTAALVEAMLEVWFATQRNANPADVA